MLILQLTTKIEMELEDRRSANHTLSYGDVYTLSPSRSTAPLSAATGTPEREGAWPEI